MIYQSVWPYIFHVLLSNDNILNILLNMDILHGQMTIDQNLFKSQYSTKEWMWTTQKVFVWKMILSYKHDIDRGMNDISTNQMFDLENLEKKTTICVLCSHLYLVPLWQEDLYEYGLYLHFEWIPDYKIPHFTSFEQWLHGFLTCDRVNLKACKIYSINKCIDTIYRITFATLQCNILFESAILLCSP